MKHLVLNQLQARLADIDAQLKSLSDTVRRLQRKYQTSWETFRERFERGALPEDADLDYVDWKAAVRLVPHLKKQRDQLKEVLR